MVRVVGPLRVVTDRPLLVSQVRVRAARDRAEQGGLTAAFDDSVPVVDGRLDMVVLPGPAVMMLELTGGFSRAVELVVPDVESASLEQCVTAAEVAGEADRRTLERLAGEVARDAAAAAASAASASSSAGAAKADAGKAATSASDAGKSASAASTSASAAASSATSAKSDADRAATIAGSTRWIGTQLEVNGELSQELMPEITISDSGTWVVEGTDTGVRAQGDPGERGPAGILQAGDSTFEVFDFSQNLRQGSRADSCKLYISGTTATLALINYSPAYSWGWAAAEGTIPPEFRPSGQVVGALASADVKTQAGTLAVNPSGGFHYRGPTGFFSGTVTWGVKGAGGPVGPKGPKGDTGEAGPPGEVTMADFRPVRDAVNNRPNGWIIETAAELAVTEKKARPGDTIYVIETGECWKVS